MSHLNFLVLACSTNFWPIKIDMSGNTVWPQASGFQKLAKMDFWRFFYEHLSTQNVNVARFARNVECDFFCDFQTLWSMVKSWLYFKEQEHEQQFKGKSQKVFRARYADGLTLVLVFKASLTL